MTEGSDRPSAEATSGPERRTKQKRSWCGVGCLVAFVLGLLFLSVGLDFMWPVDTSGDSIGRQKVIFEALKRYADAHGGEFPRTLGDLQAQGYWASEHGDIEEFRRAAGARGDVSYIGCLRPVFGGEPPTIVLYDEAPTIGFYRLWWRPTWYWGAITYRRGDGGICPIDEEGYQMLLAGRPAQQKVWQALVEFAASYGGAWPGSLEELVRAGALAEADLNYSRDVEKRDVVSIRYRRPGKESGEDYVVVYDDPPLDGTVKVLVTTLLGEQLLLSGKALERYGFTADGKPKE